MNNPILSDFTTEELQAEIESRRVLIFGLEARFQIEREPGEWEEVPHALMFDPNTAHMMVSATRVADYIDGKRMMVSATRFADYIDGKRARRQ